MMQDYVVYADHANGHRVEEHISARNPSEARELFESMYSDNVRNVNVILEQYHA